MIDSILITFVYFPVPECKTKWKSLRDYFQRRRKTNAIAIGDKLDFLLRTGNGQRRQAKTQAHPEDDLDMFFRSVACTMRKFPLVDIALVKKKIIDAVNEREIFLSNQSSAIHLVYVQNENQEFFNGAVVMSA